MVNRAQLTRTLLMRNGQNGCGETSVEFEYFHEESDFETAVDINKPTASFTRYFSALLDGMDSDQ